MPSTTWIPSNGPSITEAEVHLVTEAAREGWYRNMTRYIDEFEANVSAYTGLKYALATSSCTGAIHLAMLALKIGAGDEVIVPDITWVASAAPICYVGARPVFVDIDRKNWCLSPEALERAITRRTKAIVSVGLLGNLPEMDAILAIARRHRLPIIDDAAESIGAEYRGRKAGTFGTIGVFSFNGTKLLTTGEGGMLVTDDRRLYQRCKGLMHHGLLMRGKRSKLFYSYELGYKYKFTNIQAALGLAQLRRIDELVARRRQIFFWYRQRLAQLEGLQLNDEAPATKSTFWITTVIVDKRYGLTKERLMKRLEARGIAGRPFFYPISSMPPYQRYVRGQSMATRNPVAYALSPYGICLPSAYAVTEPDVEYVCTHLAEILAQRSGARRARYATGSRLVEADSRTIGSRAC